MNIDEYKATHQKYEQRTKQNLADLAKWAEQEALPWLWSELAGILGKKKIPPLMPHDAIRQGLQTTFADRERMPLRPNFYISHLTMLDAEVKKYCGAVSRFIAEPNPYAANATIYNLHGGLWTCLLDGIVLFEQAGHFLLNLSAAYGAWSRRVEHPFEMFAGAKQAVYGQFSGVAHDDRAPFVPIAVIRAAIEIRIRMAFGIYAYSDPRNDNMVPIDMRQLFEEIRNHLPKIEFAVDFHDVMKVYRWSNPYLHAGWRDFVWVPGYVLRFLHPLFADNRPTPDGGLALDGGIRMPRELWRTVRAAFDTSRATPLRLMPRELWLAIRGVFSRRRRNRQLILNSAEENHAACVFLD